MIPINNKCLKQQDDPRSRTFKESDMRMPQMSMPDYCSHLHTPTIENIMETYIKNQLDNYESHNYLGVHTDQYFYDQVKNNWFYNNPNCYEDFYNLKIKREEDDDQKLWSPQIKDQESESMNHEGFQACQIPKQEQIEYIPRCPFQDPNKFVGPCINTSKEQKNIQRKLKVQAYLRKKSMRSFEKKIIYKCRKEVADNRIRFRGRFISLHQAACILGLDQKSHHTPVELMEKLKSANNIEWPRQQKQIKENREIKQKQKTKKTIEQPKRNEIRSGVKKLEEEQF